MKLFEEFKEYENLWEDINDYQDLSDSARSFLYHKRRDGGLEDLTNKDELLARLTSVISRQQPVSGMSAEQSEAFNHHFVVNDFLVRARKHGVSGEAYNHLVSMIKQFVDEGKIKLPPGKTIK